MEFRINHPVEHDGKPVAALTLALDALTGADVLYCAREATVHNGEQIPVLVMSTLFHEQIAAKASGVPVKLLRSLKAPDYLRLMNEVQNFCLGSTTPPSP